MSAHSLARGHVIRVCTLLFNVQPLSPCSIYIISSLHTFYLFPLAYQISLHFPHTLSPPSLPHLFTPLPQPLYSTVPPSQSPVPPFFTSTFLPSRSLTVQPPPTLLLIVLAPIVMRYEYALRPAKR